MLVTFYKYERGFGYNAAPYVEFLENLFIKCSTNSVRILHSKSLKLQLL